MIAENTKKVLAVALCVVLIAVSSQPLYAGAGGATDAALMSAGELQALVAPIALYPDKLVAQILSGATFPDQIAIADYWVGQNKGLTGQNLMQAVDRQSWDESVKALTQFPPVLDNMAKNLSWTSSLGEAYHNQPTDVMEAVQALRAKAKAAGNLQSGPQMTVVQQSPQTIVIQPANPQVVYVPQYNPAVIYGTPYVTPGYTAADAVAAGVIGFGAGIAVGALTSGGCCGWGWSSWNCNWHGGAVVYNHNNFYGNAAWHGGYYNGGYYHGGAYGYHGGYGYNSAYNRNANIDRDVNRTTNINEQADRSLNSNRSWDSNSWAHADRNFGASSAFSGSGGWASRVESQRGWGSMFHSGFGGGRFGGGRFGGGGFHGGGFRR